ncbi:hypothetical protein JCM19233_2545 [Vibrio astriarenae]|nr:hypothetical protein JCM19233_2545 [Vibrio sp. C7]
MLLTLAKHCESNGYSFMTDVGSKALWHFNNLWLGQGSPRNAW